MTSKRLVASDRVSGQADAAKTLLERRGEVLRRWERRVSEAVPASSTASRPAIIDSLPQFLDWVAAALAHRAKGQPALIHIAARHGSERASLPSYTLEQVFSEYRILRQILLEILFEESAIEVSTIQVIDESIDLALAIGANEFLTAQMESLQRRAGESSSQAFHLGSIQPEERLVESMERFRLLADAARDYAIFMLDPQGHVISWNEGARRTSGYGAEEVLGQPFSMFYTPEARLRRVPEHNLEIAAREGRCEDQGWRIKKGGAKFWADAVISPIRSRSGKLIGFAKITRDLTEQERSTEEIRRLTEQLSVQLAERTTKMKLILDTAGEGIYGLNEKGQITFANPAASKMLGWEAYEVVGKLAHEVFHHSHADHTPYPIEMCPIYSSLRDAQTHVARGDVFWRRDGTYFTVEFTSAPVLQNGKVTGAVINFRDVTDRARAERAIREQYSWLQSVLNQLPVAVMLIESCSGRCVFQNEAAKESKYDVPTEISSEAADVAYWRDQAGKSLSLEELPRFRVARGESFRGYEVTWESPQERYHFLVNGTPLPEQFGQPAMGLLTFEDISHRRDLEESLRSAIRARDDVLAIVSHDLKNPLAAITLNSGIALKLIERNDGLISLLPQIERIERASARMDQLIWDILDVTKIEAKTFTVDRQPERAGALVSESLDMMAAMAEEKEITLESRVAPGCCVIRCDHRRILQVFSNLLGNAIKFAPKGGRVTVSAEESRDSVLFQVKDNGPGIAREDQQKIFNRYWQARGGEAGGVGLGLAIVKGVVEAHGGRVWVESEPGQGASFFFSLPRQA